MRENVFNKFLFFGGSGSGKSTAANAWLRRYIQEGGRRVQILAPDDSHYTGFGICPPLKGLIRKFTFDQEIAEKYANSLDALFTALIEKNPYLIVVTESISPDLQVAGADAWANAVRRVGNAVVLVEEFSTYIPTQQRNPHGLKTLINAGRKEGIDMLFVTQYATETNPILLKAATGSYVALTWLYCYRVEYKGELDAFFPFFRASTPLLMELNSLEFLCRLPNTQVVRDTNDNLINGLLTPTGRSHT